MPTGTSTTFDIHDKVVLVTGANRGIGEAIVHALLSSSHEQGGHKVVARKVYAAVRRVESAAPLVERYGATVVIPLPVDLSDPASIHAAAAQATDVDVVINNAGVLTSSHFPLEKEALENLQYEMQVNVFGFLHVAQAFAPILERDPEKVTCLVQINSTSSLRQPPHANFATYAASKAAAYSLTQALRHQFEGKNVKVISVHPGPIATDMALNAGIGEGAPPASVVAECVVEALSKDDFLVFPDAMSQRIGKEYQSYAESIVGNHNLKKGL